MKKTTFFFLYVFLFLVPVFTFAQNVHKYRLDNGLTLLVKPDHRFPVVVSQVWYKVGSSYEPSGITGISHALEHMMFRGTKDYPAGKFSEMVAEHGGMLNAFTFTDYTAYYEVLPANKLYISFQLEADRMQNLVLDKELFTKEMKAIQEERRLRIDDVPENLLQERFNAAAYLSTSYHHDTLGWKNDLDHMTVEDLRDWYQRWYSPNNATLVVVGDVDPEKTFELAKKYFGKIPARPLTPLKPQHEVETLGKKTVQVRVPAKLPFIMMGYPVPSLVTVKDPKVAYALLVISKILSGGESSRLEKDMIRQKQIASMVGSYYNLTQRGKGLFMLYGIPAQGHNVKIIEENFLKHIEDLKQNLVDPKTLESVKALTIAEDIFKKDSIQDQASEMGMLETVGLSHKEADEYVKQVESVTPEDIRQAARTFLNPDKMTIGILDPLPMTAAPKKQPSSTEQSLNPHDQTHHH